MSPSGTNGHRGRGRGGRAGHEPHVRIRTRELRVLELSIQGWRQQEIAADQGVSQAAVSKILARAEERHMREIGGLVGRQKARQALRLEHLYAQAMRAWEQSKTDTTRRRQRHTDSASGPGHQLAELVSENRHGDPRYLAMALGALRDLRTLYGLDAPTRMAVATTSFELMTDAALAEELATQQRLLQSATASAPPAGATHAGDEDA